jgi:hypothetical protein
LSLQDNPGELRAPEKREYSRVVPVGHEKEEAMSKKPLVVLFAALLAGFVGAARADDDARFPKDATFTTLVVTPLAIEGLTGDAAGNLYTTGSYPIHRPVTPPGSRSTKPEISISRTEGQPLRYGS